jgi:short-subunit dehydrogenase
MPFALITGASKGIGKAIAETLALRGKDLLLVARNGDLLKNLCAELSGKHNIRAFYLVLDLGDAGAAQKLRDWCGEEGYEVDTLINNAGFGLSGPFEKYSLKEHTTMMQLNMGTVVTLTYLFLPLLKKQPRAYILNIASSAGYQATPFLSLYSATKAFVRFFSRGLNRELKGSTVTITCVSPGATDTNFNDVAQLGTKARDLAGKVMMKPATVAKIAVEAMYAGKTEVITGFINKLGAFMAWLLPKKLVEGSAAKIYQ